MNSIPDPPASRQAPSATGLGESRCWWPYLAREPAAALAFLCASTSIGSLVLYLLGVAEFRVLLYWLLLPGILALAGCYWWAKGKNKLELRQRILGGLWAGLVATLVYDVARVPSMMSGIPVFKAVSYFGTVMLGLTTPTYASEVMGWLFHVSNGVEFGLMYVLLAPRPAWWTALVWGLALEALMLLTPYAEVFGYRVSRQFLTITVTAHALYGLSLWAVLRYWLAGTRFGAAPKRAASVLAISGVASLFGILAVAVSFHDRYARVIPPSPPDYIGPHLYITWDVVEPDRVAAAWVLTRFVEPRARLHFVEPFARITRGKPFDTPEAKVRRSATRSATENLIADRGLERDPALARLAHMTHLYEITPWMAASDAEASAIHNELTKATGEPASGQAAAAMRAGFDWLDGWYKGQRTAQDPAR